MAGTRDRLRALAFAVLLSSGLPVNAQNNGAPTISGFKERQQDSVDLDDGGVPLPAPGHSSTRVPDQQNKNIADLCMKLKLLGQTPEMCQ